MKVTFFGLSLILFSLAAVLPSPAGAQGMPGPDTLIIIRDIDSNNYDPHLTMARAGSDVLFMIADTLVTLDPDLKRVQPGLAKSWKVSDDGKTYTFHLKEGVTFHDGKPFTADDVVYSVKRWVDPQTKSPMAFRAGPVKDARAVNPAIVEIELERPFNELLFNLTLACGSIVDKNAVEKLGKEFGVKGFNGTGPYMFVSWEPRKEVVLKRNPNYRWGSPIYENPGPAKVENVIWRVVPEESTRVAAMMANQADLLQAVPAWALKQFSAAPNLKVHHSDQFNWLWYVGFKVDKPSVSDPKVRRALVAAVDQKEIVEKIFFGTMEPAYTYIKPSAVDFEKAVLDLVPKSDPQYAKKLLDEAGWKMGPDGFRYKDGKKLTVLLYSFNSYTKMLEAVQGYLRAVGVDLQLQLFDATVVWGKLGTQEYDAFSMSFPYFSAGDMLNIYFRSQNIPAPNRMNWKDEETDKLLDEGRAALTPEARAAAYSKVLRKVHEAAVWIPISHELVDVVGNKRVSGVKLNGAYGCALYKGLDLEIKK